MGEGGGPPHAIFPFLLKQNLEYQYNVKMAALQAISALF